MTAAVRVWILLWAMGTSPEVGMSCRGLKAVRRRALHGIKNTHENPVHDKDSGGKRLP
ncbi:hypothetical protein [Brachymonas chironomi]|uniref:hypothetical protein n=1 Tax=Brachymonas chironomi TaxID=491919 RepID=UPI0012E9D3ED|nr:hypothetical protein [Brachymonas chironomi]